MDEREFYIAEEMYKKAGLDSESIVQKVENVLNSNIIIAKNKNLS